jgi:nucleoside 2-deoxyribosyltransferase
MNIFLAASYSSQVDYQTGEVLSSYKNWLEGQIELLESFGHEVFCALRHDSYKINNANPAEAFSLDIEKIAWCDMMIAFVGEQVSAGVQTEIGFALALKKRVILLYEGGKKIAWFNQAMAESGAVKLATFPLTRESIDQDSGSTR